MGAIGRVFPFVSLTFAAEPVLIHGMCCSAPSVPRPGKCRICRALTAPTVKLIRSLRRAGGEDGMRSARAGVVDGLKLSAPLKPIGAVSRHAGTIRQTS